MTFFFNALSRSYYLCIKYHCSLDSFMLVASIWIHSLQRSEYGPLKLELLLRYLVQMFQLWRQSFYTWSLSWETSAIIKEQWARMRVSLTILVPRSSLLGAQIRDLGRSSRWCRQNNFRFNRGKRKKQTRHLRRTHTRILKKKKNLY